MIINIKCANYSTNPSKCPQNAFFVTGETAGTLRLKAHGVEFNPQFLP